MASVTNADDNDKDFSVLGYSVKFALSLSVKGSDLRYLQPIIVPTRLPSCFHAPA